jgi:hypothetical protein
LQRPGSKPGRQNREEQKEHSLDTCVKNLKNTPKKASMSYFAPEKSARWTSNRKCAGKKHEQAKNQSL